MKASKRYPMSLFPFSPVLVLLASFGGYGPEVGAATCDDCENWEYCDSGACHTAEMAWQVRTVPSCYSQDVGSVCQDPETGYWLLFYGAVTDMTGVHTCQSTGYSEDIFVTWSTTDGIEFGQDIGIEPPLTLLTSQDYADIYGQGAGGCGSCTGWHIGDPAVVYGPASETWYMFFDTQSCESADEYTWDPLAVATSSDWREGWTIQGRITSLPGHAHFNWPSVFRDPTDGRIYLFYNDPWVQMRAAELIDDGTGLNLVPANGGNWVVRDATVDRLCPYYADGAYWAVADNFGNGTMEALNVLWRLGPSSVPYFFDWESRERLLGTGSWYSYKIQGPFCLGPDVTSDGTTRCYFWGAGDEGNSCVEGGSTEAGVIVLREDRDGDGVRDAWDTWPDDARYAQDNDGDRLADEWEMAYFGHLDFSGTDDPDDDGMNNRAEFAWGYDPGNPLSFGEMPATTPRVRWLLAGLLVSLGAGLAAAHWRASARHTASQ